MKMIWFLLILLVLMLSIFGCSEEAERENPLDAQNKRTGGAPPGMEVRAGDSQVTLSWPNLRFDGIKEYKLYRSYLTSDEFQYIASIQAEDDVHEYVYTDAGLQNDGDNVYFYRLSYVDSEENEIPDLESPQNLSEDWFLLSVIPSEAPPTPKVQVTEDPQLQSDLQVRLTWEGYAENAPEDLAGFKVYSGLKADEGRKQLPLTLVSQIEEPTVEFYVDGNEYAQNIINFRKDGVAKLYRVVAFDEVGVESEPAEVEGISPNLPPSPPPQASGRFSLGINSYEVRIEWKRNLEPDLKGYVVYALLPNGEREFKKIINDINETTAIISDRYVLSEGTLVPKEYYVTAFDNTPKPDGKRDESEPSDIVSAPI